MRAKRYTVRSLSDHHVVLRDVATGIETEYWCPAGGGYVYEVDADHPGTLGRQVCDRLQGSGSTLHCSSRQRLVDIIRREARVAYRDDRAAEMALRIELAELAEL